MKILLNSGPSERGYHRLDAFLRCPRLYAFSKKLRLQQGGNDDALVLGSLIHVGLAHHYASMQWRQLGKSMEAFNAQYETPPDAIDRTAVIFNKDIEELSPRLVDFAVTAKAILTTYQNTYQYDESTFDIMYIEEVFRVMLRGKYPFTARWDLVFKDKGGKVWVTDHKTAYRIEAKSTLGYSLSGQILMAQVMGRAIWGNDFGGVRLNFIGKKAPYTFAREPPLPAPEAQASIVDSLVYAEERIEALEAQNVDPWKWPAVLSDMACMTRYGPCHYFAQCQWGKTDEKTSVDGS